MLDSILSGRSGRGRGRPRKHPLVNGSTSGFDNPISQDNVSGFDPNNVKKNEKQTVFGNISSTEKFVVYFIIP